MGSTTSKTQTADIASAVAAGVALALADLGLSTATPAVKAKKVARKPRKTAAQKARAAKSQKFYDEVIVGQREQRESRKARNSVMAAKLREHDLVPVGPVWEKAKSLADEAGNLTAGNIRSLKAVAKKAA